MNLDLIKSTVSDKIRFKYVPYCVLRLDGACYLNKKAALLLDLKTGDVISFYSNKEKTEWFLCNDKQSGALVHKTGSLFKFCDLKSIRKVFVSYEIDGKKAFFKTGEKIVENSNGNKFLFINPEAFNID